MLAAFLTPIIGGQLSNDVQTLEPGYVPTMRALLHGSEVATLQHALLAMLVIIAFGILLGRKILQLPHASVTGGLVAFGALLIGSALISRYHWISIVSLAEWIVYGIGFVACVSGLGRRFGPKAVLGALLGGITLIAILGIAEYGQARSQGDASWRIFAGWQNPNAVAGMFLVGLLLSLGFVATKSRPWLSGAAGVLSGLALVLTGSKGGSLCAAIAVVSFLSLLILWKQVRVIAWVIGVLLVVGVGAIAIQKAAPTGIRIANAGATVEQSQGFRTQLWKGTVALVKDNPVGHGLSTYPYYSAQAGTNTRTELAHSTWLQLAADAGVLAPLALGFLTLAWLVHAFRRAGPLPPEQNALRAATVSAVMGLAAHGFIESNLYYFGTGLTFFLLLGVGIQLSADAGAPEFVAPPARLASGAITLACGSLLIYGGFIAKLQANLRSLVAGNDMATARQSSEDLKGLAPFDGETWYRATTLASSLDEAIADARRACDVAPSAKYFRRLATLESAAKNDVEAEQALLSALRLDPNNLQTQKQLMDLQVSQGHVDQAKATARKLIAVEATPYFRVRPIAEIHPAETLEARLFLANSEPDAKELLREAVQGFLEYANTTLAYAKIVDPQGTGQAAGVSLKDAQEKTAEGLGAAEQLRDLYRSQGDAEGVSWADKAVADLEAALGGNK